MPEFIQSGVGQADNRMWVEFEDQHGRMWGAQTENKTRHPTGRVMPQFQAPWYPEDHYFVFDAKRPHLFRVDYDAMIRDHVERTNDFRALMFKAANKFNVPNWQPEDGPTAQMRNDIGDGPLPIAEFAKAAKAGNGFILGSRPYDADHAGDRKLVALLEDVEKRYLRVVATLEDESDEYADEAYEAEEV